MVEGGVKIDSPLSPIARPHSTMRRRRERPSYKGITRGDYAVRVSKSTLELADYIVYQYFADMLSLILS